MRSVETGRAMLRATNDGVTALIDADGRLAGRQPQFEPGVLTGMVQPRAGATPYMRVGNWAIVLVALGGMAVGFAGPRGMRFGRPRGGNGQPVAGA